MTEEHKIDQPEIKDQEQSDKPTVQVPDYSDWEVRDYGEATLEKVIGCRAQVYDKRGMYTHLFQV